MAWPRWYPFARSYRNLAHCFPGTGGFQPNQVRDDVQLIEHLFRPSVCQNINFRFATVTGAGAGVNLTLQHAEPGAGLMHLPLLWSAQYDQAVGILLSANLFATATVPLDPWGRYDAATRQIGSVRVGQSAFIIVPSFPYMRGQNLGATFSLPAVGSVCTLNLFFIELPAELLTVDLWVACTKQGNFGFNTVL